MKPTELATYRKVNVVGDKVLPSVGLRKWSNFEHGLKRTKCIYLRSNNDDIISRPMPPPKEQPVELPGIRSKGKREKCGSICVHDKEAYNGSFISKTRKESETTSSSSHDFNSCKETDVKFAEGECSLGMLGANSISSSATGSESWTSGKSSATSPRRRIRVPTAMANSSGATTNGSQYSKQISVQQSPRPPSKPRNVFMKSRSKRTDKILLGNDGHGHIIQKDDSGEHDDHGNDDHFTAFRSKTPIFGKSRHFKATTLQNIMEICHPQDSGEYDNGKKIQKRVSNPSSRRRSVGNLLNHRADRGDDPPSSHNGRRGSMPVDIRELKEKVDGIRFINVREFSRDYIENILLRRDKKATKGIGGDERRQSKCLSWLQSLEGAL